jgi:signal transduction histidine kinase
MPFTVDATVDRAGPSDAPNDSGPTARRALDQLIEAPLRVLPRTFYLLVGFPLAIASFVVLITGLSVGMGTIVVFIGLPVLAVTLVVARVFAGVERELLVRLLGREVPPARYRSGAPDDRAIRQLTRPFTDPQSWRDLVHGLITFPVSVIAFSLTVAWWSTALGGTTWWLWGWLADGDGFDLPGVLGVLTWYPVRAVLSFAVGLVALATLPWGIAALAALRGLLAELLLVAPARQDHRIDALVEGRDAGRAAEDSALRRLERDIHDGPQQRLVRLSMDLGRAQHRLGTEAPDLADELGRVKDQAQETLAELRALSRGIAPPVLADRGLDGALEELAARSAVPTGCLVDLGDERLPSHVENAAYFLVAEALTNVAKHSGASMATVVADLDRGSLVVEVSDDGIGGAQVAKGHGLAGLEQRVRAVEGQLTISSPQGGPTSVQAVIPCGS